MVQTDLFTKMMNLGRQRKEQGMADVESRNEEWAAEVRTAAQLWFERQCEPWDMFTTDDIRDYLTNIVKLPEPHHPNAWSAVLGGFVRGLIREHKAYQAGYTTSKRPSSNARGIKKYIKL